jgi:photosynthetic reaction center H subunit
MAVALTESIDVAQVVLYAFWLFFFGLVFWLRREDRREGYPLESDNPRIVGPINPVFIPPAKSFLLPHGGTVEAPNFQRDTRELQGRRTAASPGFPHEPSGDPLLSGMGPAAWAERADKPELTREGHDLIVPLRVAQEFSVFAGPDPRGWDVVAADGKVAGVVKDLWIDRADSLVRYLEVELPASENAQPPHRLVPFTMLRLQEDPAAVRVVALHAGHFVNVPALKSQDQVTLLEEERICAFYAGGRLYADAKRLGPVL